MSEFATSDALVSTEWARGHLGDDGVRFVEVDIDTSAYSQGHIPGAISWDWTRQLSDGVRRDIVSREEMGALLSRSGIGPDTRIVLYGDNSNWFAAWAYWQLKLFGWRQVSMLDGGRQYWLDHGLPVSMDVPVYAATTVDLPPMDRSLRVMRDELLARLDEVGTSLCLVDVRSPAEFHGEVIAPPGLTEAAQRAGRIPGATSTPWAQTLNADGTFKDAATLAAYYAAKGVHRDLEVIAYCRIGERSSHSWFVLHELLGYPRVRNYDGSWAEWGSLIGVPIEKGAPAQ